MPYDIKKRGGKYAIVKKGSGKTVGTSRSKKKAAASARIRMKHCKGK